MTGLIFNIQRYSIHDGPGIRTTVFMKGCPLSCTWCHNPEGVSPEPEVLVVGDRCVACGACVRVCPSPPAVGPQGEVIIDRRECVRCGRCVEACTAGARRMVGREYTPDEVVAEAARDRVFYEETGGGVTFSGGEPLAQGAFLLECLAGCRAAGIHTAVDTSGCGERDLILEVAELTDLFLFDLKLLDPERHQNATGAELAPILENLRAADDSGTEVVVRFPLIPGITDDSANLEALVNVVSSLTFSRSVHLLPFHRTAGDKYQRLDRKWLHAGLKPLSVDDARWVAEFLRSRCLHIVTDWE